MRIAYILSAFPCTSETFVVQHIAAAMAAGHAVDIHAYRVDGQCVHPQVEQWQMIQRTHYRPCVPDAKFWRMLKASGFMLFLGLVQPKSTWKLICMLRKMRLSEWLELFFLAYPLRHCPVYDVIHAHFGPNGLMALRLRQAGFLRGALLTSFHGHDANVVPRQLGHNYYRELFEQGEGFIVSSHFIRRRLEALACPVEKIHRIPVGVDVAYWAGRRPDIKNKQVWVVSVGRLVEVKGLTYAIVAMQQVRAKLPNVQYYIAGDGPLRKALETQVKEAELQGCVHFLGSRKQDELLHLYHRARVLVMPSVRGSDGAEEGQGMVLLEAQAAGLAVIGSDIGGIPESVSSEGTLVKEKDVDGLAQAIVSSLQHECDAEAGWEFVRQNFDIQVLNQHLLNLYEKLA